MLQLTNVQRHYIAADIKIQNLRNVLKQVMLGKSQLFRQNSDMDVEIDYLQDQLKKISSDLTMDQKVQNLKDAAQAEQERQPHKSVFKSQQKRLSTLEHLLLLNNGGGEGLGYPRLQPIEGAPQTYSSY